MGEHYERPTIAFDLDGTLAEDDDISPEIAVPRLQLFDLMDALLDRGWDAGVYTSRSEDDAVGIRSWLLQYGIDPDDIYVWPRKPRADLFVDDRALPALVHCWEALEEAIALALLDERRRLVAPDASRAYAAWSNAPLTKFRKRLRDVGENPDGKPDDKGDLQIVVPFTGGLDSFTSWAMATDLGLEPEAVYVVGRQPYADAELRTIETLGVDHDTIRVDPEMVQRYQHIEVGRNPAYLWAIADHVQGDGGAELWTGNRGDELKWNGGDKSVRFHLTLQQLFTLYDFDVRLVDPLAGMTKVDCVRWLASHGRLEQALMTRTCYSAGDRHCASCWACLQRELAFIGAGYGDEVRATMPNHFYEESAAELYRKNADRTRNGQRTGRDPTVFAALDQLGYSVPWFQRYNA
jgi:7-cyano-7-deazaguanine synthase in queuosine biosynthesis